jgi:hypothetical protein
LVYVKEAEFYFFPAAARFAQYRFMRTETAFFCAADIARRRRDFVLVAVTVSPSSASMESISFFNAVRVKSFLVRFSAVAVRSNGPIYQSAVTNEVVLLRV